jgi:uncharacterized Zn finger protein (UPF0148 family)
MVGNECSVCHALAVFNDGARDIVFCEVCGAHGTEKAERRSVPRTPRPDNPEERERRRAESYAKWAREAKSDTKERKPDPTERTLYTRKGGFQCLHRNPSRQSHGQRDTERGVERLSRLVMLWF